ncbi:hypothetical protein Tco_1054088 [Tanacetum coccineum]|uniref:Uncharacterized protein n=1 Tax=Tanacetum coccineum TaxID=301880 RepID=A0ABQ5GVR7_9ASTR
MELMEKRRKHFAAFRAQEKRNRPPTKAQKRTQMSTYLKHIDWKFQETHFNVKDATRVETKKTLEALWKGKFRPPPNTNAAGEKGFHLFDRLQLSRG